MLKNFAFENEQNAFGPIEINEAIKKVIPKRAFFCK